MNVPTEVLVLETPNPLDLSTDDLSILADEIQAVLKESPYSAIPINVWSEPALGTANSFLDILHVFLPNTDFFRDVVWAQVVAKLIDFMRKRFSRPHEAKRARIAYIYGPDGRILSSVELRDEFSDPIWSASGPDRSPPMMPNTH
jgi:hypothetical protein